MERVRDLKLLQRLHETNEAVGLEELSRRLGPRRSIYRWMQRMRRHVEYRPRIAYAGLGLVHLHLFIQQASPEWFDSPYAIERAWTVTEPGHDVLYLHCLVPSEHVDNVTTYPGVISVTTYDGWQTLAPLHEALDGAGRPVVREALAGEVQSPKLSSVDAIDPFVVPVACELLNPASMDGHWRAITHRLGNRVWEYLPRHTRRWRHNGKAYIRQACAYLNRYGLVLQHTVNYRPLQAHTLELLLLIGDTKPLRDALASTCPTVETYPAGTEYLVRVRGDHAMLKRVISIPGVRRWWFVDEERTRHAPDVRFQYEKLFDPRAKRWVRP